MRQYHLSKNLILDRLATTKPLPDLKIIASECVSIHLVIQNFPERQAAKKQKNRRNRRNHALLHLKAMNSSTFHLTNFKKTLGLGAKNLNGNHPMIWKGGWPMG